MTDASETRERLPVVGERRELFREFRKACDVTLAELGDEAKVSYQMLSFFETGERDLSPEVWDRVADAMEKFLIEANDRGKAEIARLKNEAAELQKKAEELGVVEHFAFPGLFGGFKEAIQGVSLAEILQSSSKVVEGKKSQLASLKKFARKHRCIDDPIVKEIEESLRREIAERQAAGDVELHDAPLYVQKMWHTLLGYRKLLPSVTAAAADRANLTDKEEQALEEWYAFELTK